VLTIFISLLIVLVSSSPIDPPQISYGREASKEDHQTRGWVWEEVTSPLMAGSNKVPSGLLQKNILFAQFTQTCITICFHVLQVKALLSHHKFSILKIPVTNPCDELSDGIVMKTNIMIYFVLPCHPSLVMLFLSSGGQLPFEAIFVSCEDSLQKPTVLILHGGPHSTSVSSYSKSSAFLASLGFNLLVVNYR
jgi:acylaminoacyl-peptidase